MKKQGFLSSLLRVLKKVALADMVIFGVVALICWFSGWRTVYHYGTGLVLAGGIVMALGAYSIVGSLNMGRTFEYQFAGSAGVDSMHEFASRDVKDSGSRYGFLALTCAIGITPVVIGILIRSVLG